MSGRNFWIGVVFGCAVLVASCSKTESPAVDTSGAAIADTPSVAASTDASMKMMAYLPDPDLVFVRDHRAGSGQAGVAGGRVTATDGLKRLFRLHMDVELRHADPNILEKALTDNKPLAFLAELSKEPEAKIPGRRGIPTLKMAIGCRDASDALDRC